MIDSNQEINYFIDNKLQGFVKHVSCNLGSYGIVMYSGMSLFGCNYFEFSMYFIDFVFK